MRYHGHNIEIVERGTKVGEYRRCQVAVDGQLSITFEVHESDFLAFRPDEQRKAFLARQGMSLIETYGDARHPYHQPYLDLLPSVS